MAANTASAVHPSPTDSNSNVISVGPSISSQVETETRMTILDFSDGTRGSGDFDDWSHMDFSFFKNTHFIKPKI